MASSLWSSVGAIFVIGFFACAESKMVDVSDGDKSVVRLHRKGFEMDVGLSEMHDESTGVGVVAGPSLQQSHAFEPTPVNLNAFIVTLPNNQDRLDAVQKWLDAVNIKHSVLQATNGSAEASAITEDKVARVWDPEHNIGYQPLLADNMGKKINMTDGERGTAMSHIRAWSTIAKMNKTMLVLEDDAVLRHANKKNMNEADLQQLLSNTLNNSIRQLPKDSDILYLSYALPGMGLSHATKVNSNLMTMRYVWTSTAYVMTPQGARNVLDRLPVTSPIDYWLGEEIANHRLKAFASVPQLISKKEPFRGHSDRNTVEKQWKQFNFLSMITWFSHAHSCIISVYLMFFIDVLHRGNFMWRVLAATILVLLYGMNYALWSYMVTPSKPKPGSESRPENQSAGQEDATN